jgi:hypothetical protein
MFCLVASSAQAAVYALPWAHATVTVPSSWTVQENYTESGLTYDLYILGPVTTNGQLIGMFAHDVQTQSSSSSELFDMLESEMENSGFTAFTYTVAPRNITIGGLPACDATISVSAGLVSVTERFTVAYSSGWHLVYLFVFAAASTDFTTYSSSIDSTIMSLQIDEKTGGGGTSSMALIAAIVVVVIVVVIVVVLLMMRKKGSEPVAPPPPGLPPEPPQAPPPGAS